MTKLLAIIHNRRHLLKHRKVPLSGLTMMSDSTPLKGERDGDFQSPTVESTDENQPKVSTTDSDKDVLGGDFDDDIDGPTSSVNNIIPMDKLKNGWFVLSSYMQASAVAAREKAIELNNSEAVQNIKKRTSETIGPAWEKSVEVALPYWEKTKEVTTPYVEKTKENAAILSENMKPRVEAGWKTVSEAAVSAAEYTTELVGKVTGKPSSNDSAQASNMTV